MDAILVIGSEQEPLTSFGAKIAVVHVGTDQQIGQGFKEMMFRDGQVVDVVSSDSPELLSWNKSSNRPALPYYGDAGLTILAEQMRLFGHQSIIFVRMRGGVVEYEAYTSIVSSFPDFD